MALQRVTFSAAMMSAQLELERAWAAVTAMEALGMPALVLSCGGKVRATNALVESVSELVKPLAFDRVALAHAPANRLFQEALLQLNTELVCAQAGGVKSIPVPALGEHGPKVVHVWPLYRGAQDIFSGADALVAISRVCPRRVVPEPTVLTGLFNLTPAEVRLCSALAKDLVLEQSAQRCGIKLRTARSYLENIFRKTGTRQQSELVALLKSAYP
ncbi:MAG: hypothetical protein LBP99_07530 [Azoarcus sp.]|jgi:DNA-binding CsgD family transcriptional regulator|nr:hypothetical protein [Azoarcus sp.]